VAVVGVAELQLVQMLQITRAVVVVVVDTVILYGLLLVAMAAPVSSSFVT
jgi:hypothetical protein